MRKNQINMRGSGASVLALRFGKGRVIGIGASVTLGILGLTMLCPTIGIDHAVYADCLTGDVENCTRSTANLDTEVTIGTSIAIGVKDKIELDLTPTSQGATSSASTKIQVATNSVEGYALYIKGDSELKNTSNINDTASSNSIKALTTSSKLADFPLNSYAYYLGLADSNTVYSPVDTNGSSPIKVTNSITNTNTNSDHAYGDEYDFTIGVRVGTNLPAGIYAGKVTLSAVANPETVRSLAGLTYMQDMTSEICANTRENYTKRLTDTRDGKSYWVAKLADGKCWMTQNLALDIYNDNGVAKAVPANQDLANITSASNFETLNNGNTEIGTDTINLKTTTAGANFPADKNNFDTKSWNMGEYVLATPMKTDACADITSGGSFEQCPNFWKVRAGAQPKYVAQTGQWNNSNTGSNGEAGIVTVNPELNSYDAHYLIGNYYQWNTAVAGNGGEEVDNSNGSVNLEGSSICPKNWRLPRGNWWTSGDNYNEFARALSLVYGYANTTDNVSIHANQDIVNSPMYLVRSGNIDMTNSMSLLDAGKVGFLRSRSYTTSLHALSLYFNNTIMNYGYCYTCMRGDGRPVRCLAE